MKKRARAAVVLLACLIGLTGCVKMDADLDVNTDQTVSGTLRIGVSKQLVQTSGQSLDDLRKEVESGVQRTATAGVSCKPFEDGDFVGSDCTLDKVPFERMGASTGDGVGFRKEGDEFVVTVKLADLGRTPAGTNPDVDFKITMPGRIVSHDPGASVHGRTATYDNLDELGSISLRSEASAGFPAWAIALIVVLLLIALGVVAFLVRRGRARRQAFPGEQYPQGPWGPQYGQPDQQPMQYGDQPGRPMQYGDQQGGPMQYDPSGRPMQYGDQPRGPMQYEQPDRPMQYGQPGQPMQYQQPAPAQHPGGVPGQPAPQPAAPQQGPQPGSEQSPPPGDRRTDEGRPLQGPDESAPGQT